MVENIEHDAAPPIADTELAGLVSVPMFGSGGYQHQHKSRQGDGLGRPGRSAGRYLHRHRCLPDRWLTLPTEHTLCLDRSGNVTAQHGTLDEAADHQLAI